MRFLITLVALFCCFFAYTQQETRNWFLHDNRAAIISTGVTAGLPLPPRDFDPISASTSVSDSAGNLLFACDGNTIIDRNLTVMPTMELANVKFNSGDGIVMAQKIPNSSKYLVFYNKDNKTASFINSSWTLKCAVVDMSLNGGDGDVIAYNQTIDTRSSRGYTIVQGSHSNDAWLAVHHNGTDSFFCYKITTTGISTTPVISKTGADAFMLDYFFNDLKTSPNGAMIGGIIYRTYSWQNNSISKTFAEIYDFDATLGHVSTHVRSLSLYGALTDFLSVEFSPDNRLFYVCMVQRESHSLPCGFGYGAVIQFNTCYTDSVDFTHYSMTVAEKYTRCFPLSTWANMQLGADKRIHMPFTGTIVSTISKPNTIGTSCNYIFNSYSLTADNSAYDVAPHFQHHLLEKPVKNNILYHGGCFPARTYFSISNDTITHVLWNFGDPSGTNNTSNVANTLHAYSAPGFYTVTALVYNSQMQLIDSLSELIEIKNPNIRLLHNYPTDTSFCQGGQLNFHLTAVNAVFYWHKLPNDIAYMNSTDTFIITESGTYVVEMHQSDCDGCIMTDTIRVVVKEKPDINLGPDRILCSGDSIKIGVHATRANFIWNTGETTDSIWVHSGGLFWVEAEHDHNGCPSRDSIYITQVPAVQFSLPNDTTLCINQTLLLNPAVSNASYFWQDSSTQSTYNVTHAGWYWVTVTSQYGCSRSDTIVVGYFNPNIFLGNDTTLCEGNSLTLHPNVSNVQYHWSNGSTADHITVNQTGEYWLTVSDGHCTKSDTIKVIFHPEPLLFLGNDTIICPYDKLTLHSGNLAATHLWQNGSTADSFLVTQPGLYWVQIQQFGCNVSDSINVWHYSIPVMNVGADKSFCSGDSLLLTASNGFSQYVWSNGTTGQQIFVHAAGFYSATGITNDGCKASDTMQVINLYPSPVVTLNHEPTLCAGDTRTLDAGAGFTSYLWNTGATSQSITVNSTGVYSVTVADNNGCRGVDATMINQILPAPKNFLPGDTAICSYETINIQSSQLYREYLWSNNAVTRRVTVEPGIYWLQVTDNHNCKGIDSILIDTKKCIEGLFVPNAFTPNHDGKNDVLKPFLFGKVKKFSFTIYNRWGSVVFQTTQLGVGWNGELNGQAQDTNSFIWVCTYQLEGQKPQTEKGTVVLIR